MDYYGNLKKKLKLIAKKQITSSLIIVTVVLITVFVFANTLLNRTIVKQSNQEISELFKALYDDNEEFLSSYQIDDVIRFKDRENAVFHLNNRLNRFNSTSITKTNILIHDDKYNLMYSSFSDEDESFNRENYTKPILNTIQTLDTKKSYNSVYKRRTGFPDLMLSRPIIIDDVHQGYATLFVSGYDWSYHLLSSYNSDSIITDEDGNIIFYTRPLLLSNTYQFINTSTRLSINNQQYYTTRSFDHNRNVIVHSLVRQQDTLYYIFLALSTLIVGILWYKNSTKVTSSIIDKNIDSVNLLIDQINSIQNSGYNQRISMSTEDEYEIIERHINEMLDRLTDLNIKNTALIEFNNAIEMKQLLLQYHPHFLYNTLEIIRSSIHFQPHIADHLIIQLTGILKYSIENPLRDVLFRQDFMYIQDYLEIQKMRFSDKFNYDLHINEDANSCIVPKLLLQPVIENSIKYGFKEQYQVDIVIKAKVSKNKLVITVQDNGPGMNQKDIDHLNKKLSSDDNPADSSIGLYNIARRLQLHYSKTSGIYVQNNENGLLVTIVIDQNLEGVNSDVL